MRFNHLNDLTSRYKSLQQLMGKQFGALVAAIIIAEDKQGHAIWACRCTACGQGALIRQHNLLSGNSRSCGCRSKRFKRGGVFAVPRGMRTKYRRVFQSWRSMVERCLHPGHRAYKAYGGRPDRPVTVCDRWNPYKTRDAFKNFLSDMGERPPNTSLDRIDPSGNYEPQNARWASPSVQANNKRRNAMKEASCQAK